MASAVTDLEAGLQAMLNLKPPGVSGSRITSLTSLCVANIQSESVLIQKIYTHFKKTPGTHKLGVLYVVDSVTRKWLEQAKSQGQPINSSAQDGTYAAGVHRVTELMPVLMNDILQSAPEDQKEKIKKLLDIWEKGQTFPTAMIESFKEKVNAPSPPKSTTPLGSPPPGLAASVQNQAPPNGSSILEALANMARQNTSTAPSGQSIPAPAAAYSMPPTASNAPPASVTPPGLSQALASSIPQPHQSYPPASQPVNVSSLPFSLTQMLGQNAPPATSNPPNPYAAAAAPPAPGAGGAGLDPNVQQQIMLIKALADQGVPFDKIPALIQSMTAAGGGGYPGAQPPAPIPAAQGTFPPAQQPWGAAGSGPTPDQGYQDSVRSPRYRGRSRSRSPERGWGPRGSPRGGRDYGRNSPPNRGGRMDDRDRNGRAGNDYRQRSPRRHGRSPSPANDFQQEKWVEFDPSVPSGHIKVLSRTLFVGGVTCSEAELRGIFGRYGTVQTCIVNKDKRHAFVKMLTRQDAVRAKEGMEDARGLEYPLRTRWGVGFGPRDCSDYSTGVSIIPIHKLTDADRKWMLTAPFGGSGGRPIDTGLSVEEPDIEIGAGVSSKAISRRMQTDKGGSNGPKSTRQREDDGGRWRRGRDDGHDQMGPGDQMGHDQMDHDNGPQNNMADFPFGISTLPNGMPNFPSGFRFPDPNTAGRT